MRWTERPPEDSPESRAEIAALNRSFWCDCPKERRYLRLCHCRSPMTVDDVRLLLHNGYGLTDIALMFGISLGRVQQHAERLHIPRTIGTKPRIWDGRLGRFRVYGRAEWRARQKAEQRLLRRIEVECKAAHKRNVQIIAARRLFDQYGRTPTLGEVAEQCGFKPATIYQTWGARRSSKGLTAKQASTAFYAACGLQKRSCGGPGHILPKKGRE